MQPKVRMAVEVEDQMKVVLVDDEPLALKYLKTQLEKVDGVEVLKEYTVFEPQEETEMLFSIDVVFLDIEMPGKNGLQIAEEILEINPQIEIVFVTAFDKYAVQAFDLHVLDYILKPVLTERLELTLERIQLKRELMGHKEVKNESLSVSMLGDFRIDSHIIQWRTTKAQELFLYLLHLQGEIVPKATLAEMLWSDFEVDKAYSQLYTTVYHIRKTLRDLSDHFTLKSVQDGYLLEAKNVDIDVKEWEERMAQLRPLNEKSINHYLDIMELYGGAYIVKHDYVWAEQERFRLQQLWYKYAKKIADWYKDKGDMEQAIHWYVKICDNFPDNEEVNFILMKLYDELQYGILVHHQYKQLKQSLIEINMDVSAEIERWYKRFRRKN